MTPGSLIVGEQFSASIRNIAILLLLSRTPDPALSAALIVTFTCTQMVASLGFATVGEPAMLAPREWIAGAGFGTVRRGALAFAGIGFASTCIVGSLAGVSSAMTSVMATLAAVMAWADVERTLHFIVGNALIPLIRNSVIVVLGTSMAVLDVQTGFAVGIVGVTWMSSCLIGLCPKPTATASMARTSWSGKRPAATGVIDVGVSYFVIQGVLLSTITLFGPSMAGPLRLAQSLLGPVQMLAAGLRTVVTIRGSSHGSWNPKRIIWLISPMCALMMVIFAFAFPSTLAEWVMGPQWFEILRIMPALAIQASLVSIGALGAARLRLLGYYTYVSGLRIISGALSLVGLWVFAHLSNGASPGVVLLGLSVGPLVTAPFWILGMRGKCSKET